MTMDPHRALASALWGRGWTLRRLSEALDERAKSKGLGPNDPEDGRAGESHLSRIVNSKARPSPSLAVAIFEVLPLGPPPVAWAFAEALPDSLAPVHVPIPEPKAPPLPSEGPRGRKRKVG